MDFAHTTVEVDNVTYFFGNNGLPEKIILPEEFDSSNLLESPMDLIIEDEFGKRLPVRFGKNSMFDVIKKNDCTSVKFHNLEVVGAEELLVGFRHDIFDDGVFFTEAFFYGTECSPRKLSRFELTAKLALKKYKTVRFAMPYRPATEIEGTIVQSAAPERELVPGDNRVVPNGIFPEIGFVVQS